MSSYKIREKIAEAVAYAHDRADAHRRPLNIVHRDINPSNVMVARSGEVKLADFGIAKAATFNAGTEVGVDKGKVGYVSPRQVKGASADQRSDLFLLGLLLYELLNEGKPLFRARDGNCFQAVQEIARFDPNALRPLPGVPVPLWAILTRARAADPAARFQRARDFADALSSYLFQHRMRVGNQDIAALFAKVFKNRVSPLETQADVAQEIRLDKPAIAAESAAPRKTPPPLPAATPLSNEDRTPGSALVVKTRELTPVTGPAPADGGKSRPRWDPRRGCGSASSWWRQESWNRRCSIAR